MKTFRAQLFKVVSGFVAGLCLGAAAALLVNALSESKPMSSTDQRFEVKNTHADQSVILLRLTFLDDKVGHCSGTWAEGVIITADHCVNDSHGQRRVRSITAIPAAERDPVDGGTIERFGRTWIRSYAVIPGQDIAVLYPARQLIPKAAQKKLGVFDPEFVYTATGYPGDKPDATMWKAYYQQFSTYGKDRHKYVDGYEYDASNVWYSPGVSAPGQSGSGISTDLVVRGVVSGTTICDQKPCRDQQTIFFGFSTELVKMIRDRIDHQAEYERRFN